MILTSIGILPVRALRPRKCTVGHHSYCLQERSFQPYTVLMFLCGTQDEGSETEIKLDGEPLKKGEQKKLKVGAKITFGDSVYQVCCCPNLRNMIH